MKGVNEMKKCVDVVVTYNRKMLLKENIEALLNQTYKNHDILIIDNASNDGTAELVENLKDDRIIYKNTGKNLGGAGGFAYGLKVAVQLGYEYAWVMDDDSIPEKDALNSLMDKAKSIDNNFSFLASLVYWTDGSIFPMNFPALEHKKKNFKQFDMIRKFKLTPILSCSFVGCFVNLKYVEKVGLPISEFFIYGDDVEFTERLRKEAKAYLDIDSVIVHKSPTTTSVEIARAPSERISRFYYQSRNRMYMARKKHCICKHLYSIFKNLVRILVQAKNKRVKRIYILFKGSISGLFFNPKIEYATKEQNEKS